MSNMVASPNFGASSSGPQDLNNSSNSSTHESAESNDFTTQSSSLFKTIDSQALINNNFNFSLHNLNSNSPNQMQCTTPIIGQKRLQRRGTTSSSFNNTSPKSTTQSNFFPATDSPCNCDLIATDNLMSTLQKNNMTLNSSTTNSSPNSSSTLPSSTCKVTVPKAPKPQRTMAIIECVILGLNLSLSDLRTKVADLTSAVTNGYNAMAKQLLQSESYLRHLEQRISTLLKLQNSYLVHLKMKDGIQNMYDAYKKSPGNQKSNLASIKVGWKDCIQKLCAIEAQTEALLGTFQFQIEKLIGFARLCPGDTYELLVKYSPGSKFRTRTKIGKDGSQAWDCSKFSFKITIQDLLLIRINEIKFLGKNLLIGERICDTRDLFSTTQTQRLTINANTSGTLKLSMLITWQPFENCEESFIYYNPTQYLTMSTKEKRLSSYTMTKLANTNSNKPTNTLQQNTSNNTLPTNNTLLLGGSNTDFTCSLQYRPNSLQVDTNYLRNSSSHLYTTNHHNVLTAITDQDTDNDFDPSAASSSSSSSSTSSSTSKKIITPKSATNSSHQISFDCSTTGSQSNLSNSISQSANTSHDSDFPVCVVASDVEKCLDSILNDVDNGLAITQSSQSALPDEKGKLETTESKCQINLIKLVEDLFIKLQRRLDHLRAPYIELNELYEQSQAYEVLIKKMLAQKSSPVIDEPIIKDDGRGCIENEEATDEDDLQDVMQYFDFLDEVDGNECSGDSGGGGQVIDVRDIDVTNMPSDFNHFLIRHFSHCIQLLDDLKFLHKNQSHSSFRLTSFESLINDQLQSETNILKNFLHTLLHFNSADNKSTNPIIDQILNESGVGEAGAQIWLNSININENLNDKCILNAEKLTLLNNLQKSCDIIDDYQILNNLMNKITHTGSIPSELDAQHTSISVYHFCMLFNLVQSNRNLMTEFNSELEVLKADPENFKITLFLGDRFFCELVLAFLVQMALKDDSCRGSLDDFIDRVPLAEDGGNGKEQLFEGVLALIMETMFNLRNKANCLSDLKVLGILNGCLKRICENSSTQLIDGTLVEFIDLQIANHSAEML